MDNGQTYADEDQLHERSTSELVEELLQHGKRLLEVEARNLRADLEGKLGAARGELDGSTSVILTEARQRVAENITATRRDVIEQVRRGTSAAKPLAIGAVLAHAGLYVLLAGLILGLATQMPLWGAALIVGVVLTAVSALVLRDGQEKLKLVGKNPLTRTHRQMTENKQWIDSTKETIVERLRAAKSRLNGIAWPKLPESSGDGHNRITSESRLAAPSSARRPT